MNDSEQVGFSPRSAYLHIPFCHRRCFYCDFAVVPLGDNANGDKGPGSNSIKSYLSLLHKEISLSPQGPPLSTVYIGGGTPSLMSPHQIKALLEHLREHFGFQSGSEISLEIDPASFEERDLDGYLDAGINRLSLGGQSFENKVLEQLGRRHRRQDLLEACKWLDKSHKKNLITSWSLDLIQSAPAQNLSSWRAQLYEAINTEVPHLSVYDLSVEPGTVFSWRQSRGELCLPDEDLSIEIGRATGEVLSEFGYSRYEISNYCLPGHASRHNRVYWSGSGWWAFGQGATSAPWGERLSRPRTRTAYEDWLEEQNQNGIHSSLIASQANSMSLDEKLLVGLRRREGVDLESLIKGRGWDKNHAEKYLHSLKSIWKPWIEKGLVQFYGRRVCLRDPEGMEVSNQILVDMIIWWDSLPKGAAC